jgi:hypothetical protein
MFNGLNEEYLGEAAAVSENILCKSVVPQEILMDKDKIICKSREANLFMYLFFSQLKMYLVFVHSLHSFVF